ncbi:MAG: efflux RND transporter periplasmic adaptor subunit [Bacteroidia bacterium]|nr:efflux RND transporter periplasmic adaptor subunit [Bacteroidia bacterium]MDW8158785.1 efflux RND transporter periplasmic adaptor subunit [Bacteroidia bacterium]
MELLSACRDAVEVEVGRVEQRTIIAKVSESGVIQPDVEVPIAPDVSGEITALYVKEGQAVKKGDLLFEIRPDNYQAALEQATASLNTAKSDYANAKAALAQAEANLIQDSINYFRNKQLYEQQAISRAEFENFRLRYEIARSAVESSRQAIQAAYYRTQSASASVRQAADNLSRTRVYASMNGTVIKLNAKVGQRVVGTSMMSGTEVIRIADLSRMEVKVMINENDIVQLRLGDTATVEVDAYPDRIFRGIVTDIAYSASVAAQGSTDQITNYEVQVLIDPQSYTSDSILMRKLSPGESPFRPGMSAVVSIFTQKAENVLAVPLQAVTIQKPDTQKYQEIEKENTEKNLLPKSALEPQEIVYVLTSDMKVQAAKVKTGISDDTYIEIKEGLQKDQQIVIGPYTTLTKKLKNGMRIKLIDKNKLKESNTT